MVRRNVVLGGRESVKVAIAQVSPVYLDRERSIERACETIRESAAGGAELIVFPEVWLAGYPYWTEGWDSALPTWVDGRVRFRDAAVVAPNLSVHVREATLAALQPRVFGPNVRSLQGERVFRVPCVEPCVRSDAGDDRPERRLVAHATRAAEF